MITTLLFQDFNVAPTSLLLLWFGIATLFVWSTLGGFPVVETQKTLQRKSSKLLLSLKHKWLGPFYGLTLPLCVTLISYTVSMDMTYRLLLWILTFGPICFHPDYMPMIWTTPVAFGIRGCILGAFIVVSAWTTLQQQNQQRGRLNLEFLSLVSFTLAAWYSCGLGCIGTWVAYPEFGEFKHAKRHVLSIIQTYFILGFGFQVVAGIVNKQ